MERIVIKLLDNPQNPKLKMKYIGAIEYATPKIGPDGKIRTGFDDNAYEVLLIEDVTERAKRQKAIKKEREDLERLLGVELNPNSSFWNKFFIGLSDEEIILDPANPMDRIKEKFLVANRYVAPSLEAISEDEEYMNCIFYMYRETEEIAKSVQKQRKLDKATGKLSTLFEENPGKLKMIASYVFGFDVQSNLTPEKAYKKLSEFLQEKDVTKQKKNIDLFLSGVEKKPEELQTKMIFDKAVKKRIITVKGGVYRRGEVFFGSNYEEAVENLGSVEMNGELLSLIKQVDG